MLTVAEAQRLKEIARCHRCDSCAATAIALLRTIEISGIGLNREARDDRGPMTAERREAIRDHADLSKNAIASRDIRELLDALDAADSSLARSLDIQRAEKQILISEIEAHAQTKVREVALRTALASMPCNCRELYR